MIYFQQFWLFNCWEIIIIYFGFISASRRSRWLKSNFLFVFPIMSSCHHFTVCHINCNVCKKDYLQNLSAILSGKNNVLFDLNVNLLV